MAFLIRRLDRGGAERQLIELAQGLDKKRFDVTIVTFYSGGHFASAITPESGIKMVCLHKRGRWDVVGFLGRLIRTTRRLRPHIVHGYMGGANELSVLAGRACGARIVWGLRASGFGSGVVPDSFGERCLFFAGAVLSSRADRIIANSEGARSFHAARGYCDERTIVIPNGINTRQFTILPERRAAIRGDWGVRDDEILIGRAARLDPMKDYPSFLKAAARVNRVQPNTRFACIGDGTSCAQLHQIAASQGVADRVLWAGAQGDMPAVYNALDICVSSSAFSEGFPNAVAEPMACGTPCVATDIGDSATIVGDAGVTVPAGDPDALAEGICSLIANRAAYPREWVRCRITDNFASDRLVASTETEFEALLAS